MLMEFLMISDLHIKKDSRIEDLKWVSHFCKYISAHVGTEPVVIFVLGDIIDQGKKEAFETADIVFQQIKKLVSPAVLHFIFIPGNHDYCEGKLEAFNVFCQKHQSKLLANHVDFTQQKTWQVEKDSTNFILCDSINDGKYSEPGILDILGIQNAFLADKENILLLHHRLLFEDKGKNGGIVNQTQVLSALQTMNIRFVFQGHAHFSTEKTLISGIRTYGVGSLGVDSEAMSWVENECDQFTRLTTFGGKVESIENLLYRGGMESFSSNLVYPNSNSEYSDGTGIPYVEYPPIDDYIPRKVMLREKAQDSFARYFDTDYQASLSSVCSDNLHVLLIADAAIGKSIELKNAANSLSKGNGLARPLLLSLRDYSGSSIQDFIEKIQPSYSTLNPRRIFLLLDGYDEVDVETAKSFRRELKHYIHQNPNTHICISMRSNFYTKSAEVFSDFSVYQLLELDREQVNKELRKQSIDENQFRLECSRKNLLPLLGSPLYLAELIPLFTQTGTLPSSSQLMSEIIDRHVHRDCQKFEYAVGIEEKSLELEIALTKMAFGMQLMEISRLDERQYQMLMSPEERELLKYSSLTVSISGGREFLHNIFKEYLVAKYLSSQTLDTIISYVYIEKAGKLNPSWFNVLGFIMQFRHDEAIIHWLFSVDPSAISRFEKDCITEELRFEVIEKVLKVVETDNVWLSRDNSVLLSEFSQSPEALDLLLQGIKQPVHFRALSAYLSLISKFTELYGQEDTVRDVLIACYRNEHTRPYEKSQAIEAVASLGLQTKEFTDELERYYYSGANSEERQGIYKYLAKSHQIEDRIRIILAGLTHVIQKWLNEESSTTEAYTLLECLKSVDSPEGVSTFLQWLATTEKKHLFNNGAFRDEAIHLLHKAAILYNSGHHELFDAVFQFIRDPFTFHSLQYRGSIVAFFIETSTLTLMLKETSEADIEYKPFLLRLLVETEPSIVEVLSEMYIQGHVADKFYKEFINGLPDGDIFRKCSKIYFSATGETILPPPPPLDYQALDKLSRQTYFDALFDENLMTDLLVKILEEFGPDVTIGDLKIDYSKHYDYAPGVEHLIRTIKHFNNKELRVVDYFDAIDRDLFFKGEIMRFLDHNRGKCDVIFSSRQRKILYALYKETEATVNVSTQYKENGHTITYSYDLYLYLSLKHAFSWDSSEEIVLQLIELPAFMIVGQDGDEKEKKYLLLEKEANKQSIIARIAQAVEQQKYTYVLEDLFYGCTRYRIKQASSAAIKFCRRVDIEDYEKRYAVEYLDAVFGAGYVVEQLVPIADDKLLKIILPFLKDESSVEIEDAIRNHYQQTGDMFFLREMLLRNMPEGLRDYIEASKKVNHPADDEGIGFPELTDAIGGIKDPTLLPLLCEAAEMMCSPGFTDLRFGSLYNSLIKAFCNCAESQYGSVKENLVRMRGTHADNQDLINFCSTTIGQVDLQNAERAKKQWFVSEVAEVLSQIKLTV